MLLHKRISVSIATAYFNMESKYLSTKRPLVFFKSRVFILPEAEICNYFIGRQEDCEGDSLNSNNPNEYIKRGRCVKRDDEGDWIVDNNIPIFSKDRKYIEDLLRTEYF